MNMNTRPILRIALLGVAFSATGAFAQEPVKWDNDPDGVQVFILAGQSNMVGHGNVEEGHGDVNNPHFPALRSDPMALSGASRRKQTPSSQFIGTPTDQ